MLIIEVKDNESIDRALKRYKRKYRNSKILNEIRDRQYYEKPSVKRRNEILNAVYREQKMSDSEN
ncbi:MAG: 30S ribosomal protein S21 [Saprospiraceae bacterium]|nr:30S ribosomal protein S21 [Saprospiraceae bacterium]